MHESHGIALRDKIVALLAPVVGAALFSGTSILIDVLAGHSLSFQDPDYILKNSLHGAAGALLTGTLFITRFLIISTRFLENGHIQVPWSTSSTARGAQIAKISVTAALSDFFRVVDNQLAQPAAQELALRTLHIQLEEQIDNLRQNGRLQFITPRPQNKALANIDPSVAESLRLDGYGLVVAAVRSGDTVQATDFQNSKHWWLEPRIALEFFELNLEMIRKGAKIIRIFGRHHESWGEDEGGAKGQLIEFQARIVGMDIYTIDYADFSGNRPFDIQPIDQLALIRNNATEPSIEWKIDHDGATEKVFFVLGEARLADMRLNFAKILSSAQFGSTLSRMESEKAYDVCQPADYQRAKEDFARIAQSARGL